jgi:hypothetical protein
MKAVVAAAAALALVGCSAQEPANLDSVESVTYVLEHDYGIDCPVPNGPRVERDQTFVSCTGQGGTVFVVFESPEVMRSSIEASKQTWAEHGGSKHAYLMSGRTYITSDKATIKKLADRQKVTPVNAD